MYLYFLSIALFISAKAQTETKCNGWSEFCNKRFNEVTLPSTHNSFAYQQNSNIRSSPFVNQNTGWDLQAQLEDGIRGFDLDVYEDDSILRLCHFSCSPLLGYKGTTLKEAGKTFLDFLKANPNEVIQITFENVAGASASELRADLSSELISLAYIHPSPSSPWPLYSKMIAENTRVIFIANSGAETSATDFLLPQNQYLAKTDYKVISASAFSCTPRDGDSSLNPNALFQLNHMLSTSISDSVCLSL
jgi:hypothetical protein